MKHLLVTTTVLIALTGTALAQDYSTKHNDQEHGFGHSWDNKTTYMRPYKQDAYGLGLNSDATGKPFYWKTQDGKTVKADKVKPNGYGLGVSRDVYGRPVKPSSWGR